MLKCPKCKKIAIPKRPGYHLCVCEAKVKVELRWYVKEVKKFIYLKESKP